MIKNILILLSFQISLLASQQIILVVADNFQTSDAKLEFYEGSSLLLKTDVNIGRNGLAWGIGEKKLSRTTSQIIKKEGDGKAPAGVFKLTNIFGYTSHAHYSLPYLHATKELICIDDADSPLYNKLVRTKKHPKSFEYMKRNDNQYRYGVTVLHNKEAIPNRGSCIFLHIQKYPHAPTAGCTSMQEENLLKIINTLDKEKNPLLIQITKSSAKEIKKLYPNLKNSQLLKEN